MSIGAWSGWGLARSVSGGRRERDRSGTIRCKPTVCDEGGIFNSLVLVQIPNTQSSVLYSFLRASPILLVWGGRHAPILSLILSPTYLRYLIGSKRPSWRMFWTREVPRNIRSPAVQREPLLSL